MKPAREFATALIWLTVVAVRQWLAPYRGVTYPGRHRVHRGCLSTYQDNALAAKVQQAGRVALDIDQRGTMTLPRRVPGALLTVRPHVAHVDVDDEVLERVRAGLELVAT